MKKKFRDFVRTQWAKSEYASAEWDSDENYGTVFFNDGLELMFEYDGTDFYQVE